MKSLLWISSVIVVFTVGLPAQVVVYEETFDTGLPMSAETTGLWQVTDQCEVEPSCSPTQWAYYGLTSSCQYDTGSFANHGVLTLPNIELPVEGATLSYCSLLVREQFDIGTWDIPSVEIDTGLIVDGPMVDGDAWTARVIDLDAFAGQTIRLHWDFEAIDELWNDTPGWLVDNIRFENVDGVTLLFEDFSNGFGWASSGLWNFGPSCVGAAGCASNLVAHYGEPSSCDYDTGTANRGRLSSPAVTIPAEGGSVSYCSYYDGEGGIYDPAVVRATHVIETPAPSSTWTQRAVDLTPFAGQTVDLRYSFRTNDEFENNYLGWQVDNVLVVANEPPEYWETFELGLAEWDAIGLWAAATACEVPGLVDAPWAYFGSEAQCNFNLGAVEGTLSSPVIDIPTDGRLLYRSAYEGEGATGSTPYDGASLDLDADEIVDGPLLPSSSWSNRFVDLDDYAGRRIRLEWRFDSVDADDNDSLGWQIDNLTVADNNGATVFEELFDGSVIPTDWFATGLWFATDDCGQSSACSGVGGTWAYFGTTACNFDTGSPNRGSLISPIIAIPDEGGVLSYCSVFGGEPASDVDLATVRVLHVLDGHLPRFRRTETNGPATPIAHSRSIGLGEFAGQSARLNFRFDSIDGIGNGGLGWIIDDVRIESHPDCNDNGVADDIDLALGVDADCNGNGVPDACDLADGTLTDADFDGVPDECSPTIGFLRGDCNQDGTLEISDVVVLLSFLFSGGGLAPCADACDVNDDGELQVSDPVFALNHLFITGEAPPAPFPGCGEDPTDDALDCFLPLGCP